LFYGSLGATWGTGTDGFHMVEYPSGTVTQAITGAGAPFFGFWFPRNIGYDASTTDYYLQLNSGILAQVRSDGSAPFEEFLNNDTSATPPIGMNAFAPRTVPEIANGDFWAATASAGFTPPAAHAAQFHENCPAWVDWGQPWDGTVVQLGALAPVRIANNM